MFDTTLELVLTVLVFGGIGVVSATRLALAVVMLTHPTQAWPRALGFAAGTTVVFTAPALIGLLGVQVPPDRAAQSTVDIILGAIILAVAVAMTVQRQRAKGIEPQPSRRPFLAAAGVGAGVAFQSFGRLFVLLAGGYRIGILSDSTLTALSATAAMVAIWQTPVWGPMLLYVFRRPRFDALAQRARPALDRVESGPLASILMAAIGIYLIIRGLQG